MYFNSHDLPSLEWRHNGRDSVSNHQPHDCLLNRLFRRRSNKTSKLHVTGLCTGNSLVTGEFLAQMASNAENVSISWRHYVINSSPLSAAYMRQWTGSTLVQVMACHLFGTKPLPEPTLAYCLLDPFRNNLHWNSNRNTWIRLGANFNDIWIHENVIENVICKITVILIRPQWVKAVFHNDVIMSAVASQITSVSIVCSTVYSSADRRKHQSSASLTFVRGIHRRPMDSPHKGPVTQKMLVRGIHRWPLNSPHKRPVTREMFPFDNVIMTSYAFPNTKLWKDLCNISCLNSPV